MPPGPQSLRKTHEDATLPSVIRGALARINPGLPEEALVEAFRKLTPPEGATLEARNRAFHRMIVDGVNVEYRNNRGRIQGAQVRVIDFDAPENNDWLAVNQFTVIENKHTRRRISWCSSTAFHWG